MGTYQSLKKTWHKLGFKGHINNYSSKPLWVVVGSGEKAVAYVLPPMTKTPPEVDADGFRRLDGKPYLRTRRDKEIFNNLEVKG